MLSRREVVANLAYVAVTEAVASLTACPTKCRELETPTRATGSDPFDIGTGNRRYVADVAEVLAFAYNSPVLLPSLCHKT